MPRRVVVEVYVVGRRLWAAADGTLVEDGDYRAVRLWGVPGDERTAADLASLPDVGPDDVGAYVEAITPPTPPLYAPVAPPPGWVEE